MPAARQHTVIIYLGDGKGGQPGGQLGFLVFSPGITYWEPAGAIAIAHPHSEGSLTVMKIRPGGMVGEILCEYPPSGPRSYMRIVL